MPISIKEISKDNIISDWNEIKRIITNSFEGADYNSGLDLKSVLTEVLADIKSDRKNITNIFLINGDGNIVAGAFSIPNIYANKNRYCDVGWFFTTKELKPKSRLIITDMLIEAIHLKVKKLGFKGIKTQIGTKQGERFLTKRYGYQKLKTGNLWIKNL